MGIAGLWDVIGDGEVTTIADFATRHFEKEGRPLRIAVDEAGWRFNNLTDAQVVQIREKEAAANPIEKTILWRILRLMNLNIQMIFIFDGARRPWKRGRRGGGRVDYERIKLLEQTLDHLKVPRHSRAPAEAEAECAKMQQAGIVDVVWSDDSDCFMFGATCQMEAHKVGGKSVEGHVRVHYADRILAKHDLDAESLVLFAMLSGGDYNVQGVPGCGPQAAKLLSRRALGVANELCRVEKREFPAWRVKLEGAMRSVNKLVQLPPDFPDLKALNHYRRPTISSLEQIQSLRGLRRGWEQQVDQRKLRILLRQRYNIWTKGYLKHLAPIFMTKYLAQCSSDAVRHDNDARFDIKLKRTRKKKTDTGEEGPALSEIKITFNPLPAVELDINGELEGEDWSIWKTKDGVHYDPAERIECEVLTCFLRHGLPPGSLQEPEPVAREPRKRSGAAEQAANSVADAPDDPHETVVILPADVRHDSAIALTTASQTSSATSKKRGRPPKAKPAAHDAALPSKKRNNAASTFIQEGQPVATFRHARTIEFKKPTVIDLDDSDSEHDIRDALDLVAGRSHLPLSPRLFCMPAGERSLVDPRPNPDLKPSPVAPGSDELTPPSFAFTSRIAVQPITRSVDLSAEEPLSPAAFRARRHASFEKVTSGVTAQSSKAPPLAKITVSADAYEVIDLT
nr:hypothetical protein B0A51_15208 [Rachicladosporium sp. CCFEE 5018]